MNLQLSDGTTMQIPDDATPEAIKNFAARGEAHIKANPVEPAPQEDNPYGTGNTVGRMATDALLGLPDLAIAAHNAGFIDLNVIDRYRKGTLFQNPPEGTETERIAPLAPQLREKFGVAELPEDAPYHRRILEGIGSSLPYGAGGIVKAGVQGGIKAGIREFGKNTVLPTVTADAGARAGGAIGGEQGALIGGVLGGVAPSARPTAENLIQQRYTGRGDPNAPAIAAAAENLGIEPTAGALGNYEIQKRENAFAANYPGGLSAREQTRIRGDMTAAGEDIAVQRGATGASVAETGDDIRTSTANRLQEDRDYSSGQQENLQRTIGDDTRVPITELILEAMQGMNSPSFSATQRRALQHRLEQHIYPLMDRNADGTPRLDAQGNATAPYGAIKQFRTELGQSFEQGGTRYGATRELYEPATDAMAVGAQGAGIPRSEFNAVQQFTRGVEGPGGLAERLAPYDKEPAQVHNWTLEGGRNNPDRLSTFANETDAGPRVFGNYLQQKVGETLGAQGRGAAQGPNKFAEFVEKTDPGALNTIAGPQTPRVQTLERSHAVSTCQPVNARSAPRWAALLATSAASFSARRCSANWQHRLTPRSVLQAAVSDGSPSLRSPGRSSA